MSLALFTANRGRLSKLTKYFSNALKLLYHTVLYMMLARGSLIFWDFQLYHFYFTSATILHSLSSEPMFKNLLSYSTLTS